MDGRNLWLIGEGIVGDVPISWLNSYLNVSSASSDSAPQGENITGVN